MKLGALLLEAVTQRSKLLKQIDQTFADVLKARKKGDNIFKYEKVLAKQVSKFMKGVKVEVRFMDEFNAMVSPVYKHGIVFKLAKDIKATVKRPKDVKDVALDNTDYIEKIYIFIGLPLLEIMTPTEMTAILLHEIGHTFQRLSKFGEYVYAILGRLKLLTLFMGIMSVQLPLIVAWLLMSYTFAIIYSPVNRKREYDADQYAVKYGYGDDLIKALVKLYGVKQDKKVNKLKAFMRDVINMILIPLSLGKLEIEEHPEISLRIMNILNQMTREFYKGYKDVLSQKEMMEIVGPILKPAVETVKQEQKERKTNKKLVPQPV